MGTSESRWYRYQQQRVRHDFGSPDSSVEGWSDHTNNNPLETAYYEPHDRSLQFHITRMGVTMTHRDDADELSFTSLSGTDINVGSTPEDVVWKVTSEQSGGRWFLRVYDPTTNKGVIASILMNTGSNKFTGVVVSPVTLCRSLQEKLVSKSYPHTTCLRVAHGSLRHVVCVDHSEHSGSSPDMPNIDWSSITTTPLHTVDCTKDDTYANPSYGSPLRYTDNGTVTWSLRSPCLSTNV